MLCFHCNLLKISMIVFNIVHAIKSGNLVNTGGVLKRRKYIAG